MSVFLGVGYSDRLAITRGSSRERKLVNSAEERAGKASSSSSSVRPRVEIDPEVDADKRK